MTGRTARRSQLVCGSCGDVFQTWDTYIDQDQDRGYGICHECQADAETRANQILDDAARLIEENLSPHNVATFNAMDTEKRRAFTMRAIDRGLLHWRIET